MFDVVQQKRRGVLIAWVVVAGMLVAACQPQPQERYERAARFFENADYRASIIELKNAIRSDPDYAEARLMLARASYQLADYGTAESEFVRCLELGLDQADVWAGYGRVLYDTGRSAEAMEKVVPNLEPYEDNAAVQIVLGDVYSALGNFSQADTHYNKAVSDESAAVDALAGLARTSMFDRRLTDAESYVDKALQVGAESSTAWTAKGNLARAQGNLADAAAAYKSAIDFEVPETPYATRFLMRSNRISALLDSQRYDEAAEQLAGLESIFPRHPVVNYFRGRVAYGLGEFDLAQNELQEYLSNSPNDLRGEAWLGAVNFSQNYLRQAETFLLRAARANVGGEATRRLLAETQLRLNKPESALESLRLVDQGESSDPEILAMMGRAELGLGNTDSAIRYFEQGVEANPDNAASSLSLATGLLASGDYDRAIEVLKGMPAEQADDLKRDTLLLAAFLKSDEPGRAVAESERMMRERPDDTRVYALAGVLQQSIGNSGRAEEYFLQAVELDSGNLSAQFGLTKLAIARGDNAMAEMWINRVLDLSPDFMPGLVEAAKIFPTIGKQEELQRRVQAAIANDPKALAPRLLSSRIAIIEGRHEDALALSRATLEEYPDDPRLMHTEGLALAGMGQIESGLSAISRAAKMDPKNETLLFDLARMNMSVKNYPAAAEAAQQFYALRPDSSKGLAILSESLAKSGRQDQARTILSEYRKTYPNQVLPLLLSGDVEMLDEQPRAALAYYESAAEISMSRSVVTRLTQAWREIDPAEATKPIEEWLEQNPDDAAMRRLYAQLLDELGDDAAAAEQYEAVLGQQENDAVALNNLAWKYSDAGRPGAVELAEKAHRLNPENGSITDTLGWMLYLDGEYDRALEKLRLAATQSPDNPEVAFHLVVVLTEVDQRAEARSKLDALLREHDDFPSREQAELLDKTL